MGIVLLPTILARVLAQRPAFANMYEESEHSVYLATRHQQGRIGVSGTGRLHELDAWGFGKSSVKHCTCQLLVPPLLLFLTVDIYLNPLLVQ